MQTSQPAVARLESGRHDAQLPTLARFADALGLSLLSLDFAGDAGTPASGPGDDTQPEARPEARPGRKPGDNGRAAAPLAADTPGPDHVLSRRQRKVLQVIRESIEQRGYPPTMREIGDAIGLKSPSSVSHHIRTLQRAGYLNRDSGRPRTVEVRDYTAVLRVRSGTGFGLRRNAFWVKADDRPGDRDWDLVATPFTDIGALAEYAASFGRDVVVLDPPELREAVIAKLKAAVKVRPAMSAKPEAAAGEIAPGGAQGGTHVVMPAEEVEEVAARLGAALAAGRRVHLEYYSEYNDLVTERDVDPMRLSVFPGRPAPYLIGWCLLRKKRRTFRLDRVLSLEVLDELASPPAEEYANLCQGVFEPSEGDMRVELELSGPGRRVTEYYPFDSVTELGDGRLRVELRTPGTGWVWRLALRLGEDGRVVSPSGLVAQIRWKAADALANYETSGQAPETARAISGSSAIAAAATTRPSATAGA
jgi:predicted DNA-binding transcriptional regulator YafY